MIKTKSGKKNLIGGNLALYRESVGISQRGLATRLQLQGADFDKNVITRIETGKRGVSDIELVIICQVLGVDYESIIDSNAIFS